MNKKRFMPLMIGCVLLLTGVIGLNTLFEPQRLLVEVSIIR